MRKVFQLIALGSIAACAPVGLVGEEFEAPKRPGVAIAEESFVVKLDAKGKAIKAGEEVELEAFLASLGPLHEVDFALRRTHKGLSPGALAPVETALLGAGADPRRVKRLAEIGVDYLGHWADVEIVAVRHVASLPECPDFSRVEIIGGQNVNSSNFGCATASAFALQVADPKDLVAGRTLDPAPSTPAAAAIDRYNTDKVKELRDNRTDKIKQ